MKQTETKPKRPTHMIERAVQTQTDETAWRTDFVLKEEPKKRFDGREIDRETLVKICEKAFPIEPDHAVSSLVATIVRREAKVRAVLFGNGAGVSPEEAELIHASVDAILGPEAGWK